MSDEPIAERVEVLVEGKRQFLRFLESRLRDRTEAEDLLPSSSTTIATARPWTGHFVRVESHQKETEEMRAVTVGLGFGLAALLGLASGGGAQAPDHRGMVMESPARAVEERPHAGMAMPEPMEEPIPEQGVPLATETKGAQPLPFRIDKGVTGSACR